MTGRDRAPDVGRRVRVEIPAAHRGERLDQALAGLLPGQSRSAVQRLMREGRVLLRGVAARPADRVRGGERLEIDLPAPLPAGLEAEDRPLAILYEDGDLVVIDKPCGLTVHPGAGTGRRGTLVNALLHHCRDLSGVGGIERPGIVHRLDRETTGVLVVAKNDAAHRSLAAQFKSRAVRKVYVALVWGSPRSQEGIVDAPIGRHPSARVRMAVRPGGRGARTRYRLVTRLGPSSLMELHPETGRTHQLRVHMQWLRHPIVGDPLYGGERATEVREPRARRALLAYPGLALHAWRLGFTHPGTGAWREFEAPLPPDLAGLIETLRAIGEGAEPREEERP
jgi:23S rRNA pseudouridine1911/1915/1917 synthase